MDATKNLGEWVLGDQLKKLRLNFEKRDKSPFDLTDYAVTLFGEHKGKTVIEIAGEVVDADGGVAEFEDLTNGVELGNGVTRKTISCRATAVKDGAPGWTELFEFDVVLFPTDAA